MVEPSSDMPHANVQIALAANESYGRILVSLKAFGRFDRTMNGDLEKLVERWPQFTTPAMAAKALRHDPQYRIR